MCALVNRAVTEKAEGYAAGVFVFLREGKPEGEWNMAADDSVAAHVAHFRLEVVHGTALAL